MALGDKYAYDFCVDGEFLDANTTKFEPFDGETGFVWRRFANLEQDAVVHVEFEEE